MRVQTIRRNEFCVRAGLNNASLVHHHDTIGPLNGCQPVRDDQGGAPSREMIERSLYYPLALGVERGCRLVQQENRPIGKYGACNRYPLPLPTRKLDAPLAQVGIVALRQGANELIGIGGVAGHPHLIRRRVRAAIAHILEHTGGEYHSILRHQRNLPAHRQRVGIREGHAVDRDAPGLRIVEAQQHLEDSRLARS